MEDSHLKKVSIFDSSVISYNLGNQIIAESVQRFIDENLSNCYVIKLQYAERIRHKSKKYIRNSDVTILAGTNSLSSNMLRLEQFPINLFDLITINNLVLCGVGWFQYQKKPNFINKTFLKTLLSDDFKHSVRDSYTKKMLNSIGINNVINTSCPTLWNITPDHIATIPNDKAKYVVTTLTDYNKDEVLDLKLLQLLDSNYERVFFWPQGLGDYEYLMQLVQNIKINLEIVRPNLRSFDSILDNEEIDYVGTRLHAGIRAIQKSVRTFIVAIDNRTKEISKDINLNSAERLDFDHLKDFINTKTENQLVIPYNQIEDWKSQFRDF